MMRRGSTYVSVEGGGDPVLTGVIDLIPYRDNTGYTPDIDRLYPPAQTYRTLAQAISDRQIPGTRVYLKTRETGADANDRCTFGNANYGLSASDIGGAGMGVYCQGPNVSDAGDYSLSKHVTATADGYGKTIRIRVQVDQSLDVRGFQVYINGFAITGFSVVMNQVYPYKDYLITLPNPFTQAISGMWGINWGEKFLYGAVGYFYRYGANTAFLCQQRLMMIGGGSSEEVAQAIRINGIYIGNGIIWQ